jgi:uncharacterized membrane protein
MSIRYRLAVVLLVGLALGITGFMMAGKVGPHQPLPGCGAESACHTVTEGRWALIAGLPVSALGFAGYLAILCGLFALERKNMKRYAAPVWWGLAAASLVGLGFIAWLVILQGLVIRHFCLYCMTAHLLGGLAFLLILRAAPVWRALAHPMRMLVTPSAGLLGLLVATHILVVPDLTVVQAAEDMKLGAAAPAPSSSGIQIGRRTDSRTVALLEGNLTFDLFKIPVLGPREAPKVVLELYDYTCPSCRKVSRLMDTYGQERRGQVAVILLPAPMDADCNPAIRTTLSVFKDACTYARLALAVYKADAARFAEYHAWLMTGDLPPAPAEARERAEILVGKEALAAALASPEVDQWIRDGLGIYSYLKADSLPKLIAGSAVISSAGLAREKLFRSLDAGLGAPVP